MGGKPRAGVSRSNALESAPVFLVLDTLGDLSTDDVPFADRVSGLSGYSSVFSGGGTAGRYVPLATAVIREGSGGQLPDLIGNTSSFLILSKRASEILDQLALGKTERAPITIARGKTRTEYFLVNPTETVRCLRSAGHFAASWAADHAKLCTAPPIFRPFEHPTGYVVREDLARAWVEAGVSNLVGHWLPRSRRPHPHVEGNRPFAKLLWARTQMREHRRQWIESDVSRAYRVVFGGRKGKEATLAVSFAELGRQGRQFRTLLGERFGLETQPAGSTLAHAVAVIDRLWDGTTSNNVPLPRRA